jgi:hypothetical protein
MINIMLPKLCALLSNYTQKETTNFFLQNIGYKNNQFEFTKENNTEYSHEELARNITNNYNHTAESAEVITGLNQNFLDFLVDFQ